MAISIDRRGGPAADLISYHQTEKEETITELTSDFYL